MTKKRKSQSEASAVAAKVAVVAGVGPGLGLALTQTFAAAGYTVLAAARRAPTDLVAGTEGAVAVRCDVTAPDDVDALFAAAAERGSLEAAVFNAGTFERGAVVDTDPDDFERCWRVGCFGGFLVGRAAARQMLEHGTGTILFTGATASLRGGASFVNLASPKFGLRAVAQSMARELGPRGIHVAHVIIDGQIRSERYEHLRDERGPDSLLEPQSIAAEYLRLHRQPRSAWTLELDLRPWTERF
jgi:NAD(P)-dependent dehydrogenase (short-subunit alcohol dehydrogenase family)